MTALRILRNAMHLGYVDFRYQWSPASWLGGWCVRVLAQTTFFALIGQLLGSPLKVEYLLIGNSIMVGCEAALLAVQATTWERFDGTYPLLVVAPASMLPSVVGRTSAWLIDGMATAVIAFYAAALPVKHGVQAVRLALAARPAAAVLTSALLEVAVAASWLLMALVSFNTIAERGRTDGSIELV